MMRLLNHEKTEHKRGRGTGRNLQEKGWL
uniref:Uncharacterized protein n=1 Tax=Arundo donax TaxID=35708 RepID=A0A0A9EJB8_ARUDO